MHKTISSGLLAAAAAALLALTFLARPVLAGTAQAALPPPIKVDRVIVLKSQRKLALMRGEEVLRIYSVALGRYPNGHKQSAGDSRTPEGSYVLDRRLTNSQFHRAIHISYPNPRDVAEARRRGDDPGGSIMIHGLPKDWSAGALNHPKLDWTQGCIAVTNQEMDEIWRLVADGTPIEIDP